MVMMIFCLLCVGIIYFMGVVRWRGIDVYSIIMMVMVLVRFVCVFVELWWGGWVVFYGVCWLGWVVWGLLVWCCGSCIEVVFLSSFRVL